MQNAKEPSGYGSILHPVIDSEQTDLSEQLIMAPQQLEEELQEACGVDQILIPQENQSLAEGLKKGKLGLNAESEFIQCEINKSLIIIWGAAA